MTYIYIYVYIHIYIYIHIYREIEREREREREKDRDGERDIFPIHIYTYIYILLSYLNCFRKTHSSINSQKSILTFLDIPCFRFPSSFACVFAYTFNMVPPIAYCLDKHFNPVVSMFALGCLRRPPPHLELGGL